MKINPLSLFILFLLALAISSSIFNNEKVNATDNYVQQTPELYGKVKSIQIETVTTSNINLTVNMDFYNPSQSNLIVNHQNTCGFLPLVSVSNSEIPLDMSYYGVDCFYVDSNNLNQQTYYPGLNNRSVDIEIYYPDWNSYDINDLPMNDYRIEINSSPISMETYGAYIFYNSSGQFFVNYDQNNYNFWDNSVSSQEINVSNNFSRTGILVISSSMSGSTTSQIVGITGSNADFFIFIFILGIIAISGILFFMAKSRSKKIVNYEKYEDYESPDIDYGSINPDKIGNSCEICGSSINPGDMFCNNCGNRIS